MRAINIEWECDDDDILETLPDEIELPDDIEDEDTEDFISDSTGYLVRSFEVCETTFIIPVK